MEVSRTPNMDFFARNGKVGLVRTIPEGMPPGSDVANMSLMGYSPRTYYTGRAPLEAASMGLDLGPDDVAFRCNLVTLEERREGLFMADYSGGSISTERARTYIEVLNDKLAGPDFEFHPGVSYRHILLWRDGRKAFEGLETTPPHDILGQPVDSHLPSGPGSRKLKEMTEEARGVMLPHLMSRAETGPRRAGQWHMAVGTRPQTADALAPGAIRGEGGDGISRRPDQRVGAVCRAGVDRRAGGNRGPGDQLPGKGLRSPEGPDGVRFCLSPRGSPG